jgi:uncharacterized repeat protein (TIGR01451 family)
MRSRFLAIGMVLILVGLLVGVGGCSSSRAGASINVEKKVSVDGGVTWEEEVEQYVCQNVRFQIVITNDGDEPLNNIFVSDALSGYLDYSNGTANHIPDDTSPYLIWNFPGPLQLGETLEITFTAHVTAEGEHTNCVKVRAETGDGTDVSAQDCAMVMGGELVSKCGDWSGTSKVKVEFVNGMGYYAIGPVNCCDTKTLGALNANEEIATAWIQLKISISCAFGYIPSDCQWVAIGPDSSVVSSGYGSEMTLHYDQQAPGMYMVVFSACCGAEPCCPCVILVEFLP